MTAMNLDRRRFLGLAGAALLAGGGCGLTEYETQMGKQQKRIEYLDKEADFLDEPLEEPPPPKPQPNFAKKDKDKDKDKPSRMPLGFFLRAPKGIEPRKPKAVQNNPSLFQYGRSGGSAARPQFGGPPPLPGQVQPGKPKEMGFRDVFVASWSNMSRDNFWNDVLTPLGIPLNKFKADKKAVVKKNVDDVSLSFEYATYQDPVALPQAVLFIYFYEKGNDRIGIVYRVDHEKEGSRETLDAIDFSLQSLAIGGEDVAKARRDYRPRTTPGAPPAPLQIERAPKFR